MREKTSKNGNKGVYCLVLSLNKERDIRIGRKKYNLPGGFYCYVGSALNNLEKRIERHIRVSSGREKTLQWNIDYLTSKANIVNFKTIQTEKRIECRLSDKIKGLSDGTVKGFGSSDCKCGGHLHYFKESPLFLPEFHRIFEEARF